MGFYIFRFETVHIKRKRGNIPDDDAITFTVMVNQMDRGHGAGFFPAMVDGSVANTWDITVDGLPAYPARNRLQHDPGLANRPAGDSTAGHRRRCLHRDQRE